MAIKVRLHPITNNLRDCGYSKVEEIELYDKQLKDLLEHPREYLDNMNYWKEYKVFWKNYVGGNNSPVLPYTQTKSFIKRMSLTKEGER